MGRRRPALFGLLLPPAVLRKNCCKNSRTLALTRLEKSASSLCLYGRNAASVFAVQSSIADCDQPAARPVPRA